MKEGRRGGGEIVARRGPSHHRRRGATITILSRVEHAVHRVHLKEGNDEQQAPVRDDKRKKGYTSRVEEKKTNMPSFISVFRKTRHHHV